MAKKKISDQPGSTNYLSAAEKMNRWNTCQRIAILFNRSMIPNMGIWHIKEWLESEKNFLEIIKFIEEKI